MASESKASTEAPGAEELTEEVASQVKKAAQTIEADVAQVVGEAAETIQVQAGAKDEPRVEAEGLPTGCNFFGACGA